MKKILPLFLIAALPWLLPANAQRNVVENPGYAEALLHLETGGSFLLFMNGEQVVETIDGFLETLEDMAIDAGGENLEEFKVFESLYAETGISSIRSLGMSSRKIDDEHRRTRSVMQHNGDADGLMWKMYGTTDKPFALNTLPESSGFAMYGQLDLNALLNMALKIEEHIPELAISEALDQVGEFIDVPRAIQAMDGNWGLSATLHPTRTANIPLPEIDEPLDIPEPGLAFSAQLSEPYLPNQITKLLTDMDFPMEKKEIGGHTAISVPIPMELPVKVMPTFVEIDGTLLIASTPDLLEEMIGNLDKPATGLNANKSYQNYLTKAGVESPAYVSWMAPEVFKMYMKTIQENLPKDPEMAEIMELMNLGSMSFGQLQLLEHLPTGYKSTSIQGGDFSVPMMYGTMVTSILAPAIQEMQSNAKLTKMRSNGRSLYTIVLANGLGDGEPWPTKKDRSSTRWAQRMVKENVMTDDMLTLFAGPHTFGEPETADEMRPWNNGWSVVAGLGNATEAGTPFLISSNCRINNLNEKDWSEKVQPSALGDYVIIASAGGATQIYTLEELDAFVEANDFGDFKVLHP